MYTFFFLLHRRYSPVRIVQIMKSISAKQVFKGFPHLKDILWNRKFWSDGYLIRTVGDKVTAQVIQRYIQYQYKAEQLELDFNAPQLCCVGIFTSSQFSKNYWYNTTISFLSARTRTGRRSTPITITHFFLSNSPGG